MTEYGSGGTAGGVALYVKRGTGTITAGQVTVNVPHELGYAPTGYVATSIVNSLGVDIYIASVDATNLVVSMDFAQASDVTFSWVCS